MNEKREEFEIDLLKLLLVCLQKWWLFVLGVLVAAGIAFAYTKYCVVPLYRASVTIYVNNTRSDTQLDSMTTANLNASQQLVDTYINIIKSNTVLNQVVEESHLNCGAADVRSIMSTSRVGSTEMFQVHITHPDPETAATVANAVANVAPHEIEQFVEGSSTKIIDYATVPNMRYTPSYSKNVMMGGLIGAVLVGAFVVLQFLLDVRIKDEDDLVQLFDYPILGQIPQFDQISANRRSGYSKYGYEPHETVNQKKDGENA